MLEIYYILIFLCIGQIQGEKTFGLVLGMFNAINFITDKQYKYYGSDA